MSDKVSDKVINLANAKRSLEDKVSEDKEETFEEIMERNRKNKERLAKERAQANKSVLRSYRIKST